MHACFEECSKHLNLTARRTFEFFVTTYLDSKREIKALQVGSQNSNGFLRDFKSTKMNWFGIDVSQGLGVELIVEIGATNPFEDDTFELVVASSVFEHDIQLWNTFLEMVRVMRHDAIILLIMPSQGFFIDTLLMHFVFILMLVLPLQNGLTLIIYTLN